MSTTVAIVAYLYWNVGEAGFTVLAICGKGTDLGSSFGRTNTSDRERAYPDWDNLYDGPGFGTYVTVSGGGSTRPKQGVFGKNSPPSDGINITQDVDITMTDFA